MPIIGLFVIFLIDKKILKVLLMTFILFLLFFIKSRASFYAYFIVYFVFLAKEIGYKNFFYLILISILSFLILYCLEFIKIDTRVFGITTIYRDSSFNERIEQFNMV
ncbi:MAG: hypothetical protein ACOCM0_06155 [Campylobacter hyointestinalis]